MTKVAIVILNWNGAAMMKRFLPSVVNNATPDAEVWVADNASTDESLELLAREFPTVKTLVLEKNWGFAEGYNKALAQIEAEYFVLLNSDVEVTPGWLSPLVKCLDENPDVAAVQPKLLKASAYDSKTTTSEVNGESKTTVEQDTFEYAGAAGGFVDKFGYPYCRGRLFGVVEEDNGQYNSIMEIHWATGACLMIRANDYHESGGLDGRFFAHNEEIDLCWRLRIMGRRILCIPESRVYHLGGGTLPQGNPRKTYLNFRNNLTMLYKNLPEKQLKRVLFVRTILDYVAALQSLLKGNMGDVKAIIRARRDFRAWKKEFYDDRIMIQNKRTLPAEKDLSPISILWQYYARGIRRWSKLPSFIILFMLLLSTSAVRADNEKTRGIGVYPGRPSESFAPTLVTSNTYRNLSANHTVYQSSCYDYNLTAQLLTDGIAAQADPPRLEVMVNGKAVGKREREWTLDGVDWSGNNLVGSTSDFSMRWVGMKVGADSIVVNAAVAYNPEKATRGFDYTFSVDGKPVVRKSQNGLPGEALRFELNADPNKQMDQDKLPGRIIRESFKVESTDSLSQLTLHFNMPGAVYWKVAEVKFFAKGKIIDTALLPQSQFQSAWMSEAGGDQWVYVDLGAEATFDKVRLYWMRSIPQGQVEVSDNATNWTPLAPLPTDQGPYYEMPVEGKGRYVRVSVKGSKQPYMLTEMEVFGRGGLMARPHVAATVQGDSLSLSGGDWRLHRASDVQWAGTVVSRPGFPVQEWIPATVPGTVLTSFVNVGAVPDQNYDGNVQLASESFFNGEFWYRRTFKLPDGFAGKRTILNFDGIAFKAEVWLNGEKLGDTYNTFMRERYDITPFLKADENILAIKVAPAQHPGATKEKILATPGFNGGMLGADNPSYHASVGWDWIPTVRGREMGIWDDVTLTAENAITLYDPLVSTSLNLPDTLATLTPVVMVHNNARRTLKGTICGWVGDIKFEKKVTLRANPKEGITFTPEEFPQLRDNHLRLWWPNGYGDAYLYDAGFCFISEEGDTLSTIHYKQGIRQVTYEDMATQLKIRVNGKRVVPYGGNWGFPEQNLNYRAREYDTAVRNHRDMNFNMIRNWVGQTDDKEFYDACDKYGIMVWQDFWLANPADGPNPQDQYMFRRVAQDYVLKIRQHASITIYCGRNEGYPPSSLDTHLPAIVERLHPGMGYIASSADDGVSGHGPYWAIPEREYFARQSDKLHSEKGMPNILTPEGMHRMLRPEHLWPQNEFWGQHDFTLTGAQQGATFNKMLSDKFGEINSAEQFAALSQFINYDGYRAMYESGSTHRMGLLIWMSHAAWPSMTWQCYDYYFEPTAAYFGCKKACEPLHIQYNALSREIEVVNIGVGSFRKLQAEVEMFSQEGKSLSRKSVKVDSPDDSTMSVCPIEQPKVEGAYFMRLKLTDKERLISENTYLLSTQDTIFTSLAQLPEAEVKAEMQVDGTKALVTLEAPTNTSAVMVRLCLKDTEGEQLLPVTYDDNYFHLMPGEKKTVTITWKEEDQKTDKVRLQLSGFNLRTMDIEQ